MKKSVSFSLSTALEKSVKGRMCKMYAVITENDISQWDDKTGERYHFPFRYRKYLEPGTRVVFYKGVLKDRSFKNKRLSDLAHYFACGIVSRIEKDVSSHKQDLYAFFSEYKKFECAVLAKENGVFIEKIPENRKTNYWRDGVRPIEAEIFFSIIGKANIAI